MTEWPVVRDVRLTQSDARDWAQAAGPDWADHERLVAHLRDNTHHIETAESVSWEEFCRGDARVLDLGCGSGWLTGMLSRQPGVGHVLAWDSSPRLLGQVLPGAVALMDGRPDRVERVCGDFLPLLVDERSIDLVVMSSAFHHTDRPEELLGEFRRILRPDGAVVLLNETPGTRWRCLASRCGSAPPRWQTCCPASAYAAAPVATWRPTTSSTTPISVTAE